MSARFWGIFQCPGEKGGGVCLSWGLEGATGTWHTRSSLAMCVSACTGQTHDTWYVLLRKEAPCPWQGCSFWETQPLISHCRDAVRRPGVAGRGEHRLRGCVAPRLKRHRTLSCLVENIRQSFLISRQYLSSGLPSVSFCLPWPTESSNMKNKTCQSSKPIGKKNLQISMSKLQF